MNSQGCCFTARCYVSYVGSKQRFWHVLFLKDTVSFGGFHSHGGSLDGLFHGKPKIKMDENWGYPYFRKLPFEEDGIFRTEDCTGMAMKIEKIQPSSVISACA